MRRSYSAILDHLTPDERQEHEKICLAILWIKDRIAYHRHPARRSAALTQQLNEYLCAREAARDELEAIGMARWRATGKAA